MISIRRGSRNIIAFIFELVMTNSDYYGLVDPLLSSPDTLMDDGSIVLWKRSYTLRRNDFFNGWVTRNVNGRTEIINEIEIAFKFPSNKEHEL
jgi:hypothetical protein